LQAFIEGRRPGLPGIEWDSVIADLGAQYVRVERELDRDTVRVVIFVPVRDRVIDELIQAHIQVIDDSLRKGVMGSEAVDQINNFLHFCNGVADHKAEVPVWARGAHVYEVDGLSNQQLTRSA
jgi:hypothetical protein